MKFSICIPNYNYETYLGKTLDSVLNTEYKDFEIVIADNASSDGSVPLIQNFQKEHSNISLRVNPSNIGFSGNLDRCAQMAAGENIIMLSSDDLMTQDALPIYAKVVTSYPNAVVCSSWNIIDSKGAKIGYTGPNKNLWLPIDRDGPLSLELNCDVYRIRSSDLLKRCLKHMATPFNFCTASYRRTWYEKVGGYGGGRLINPDKWFHWKLLTAADEAIFIDRPLFEYRWHTQNQTSQQAASGYLKYMLDEYRNVIEINPQMLSIAGISRRDFERYFVKRDIYKHGVGEFLKGRWSKSARIFLFGLSSFPSIMIRNPYFIPFLILLLTTPIGSKIAASAFKK
jgi:glycosyltransferase involved in cell wall biosynthesis